MRCKRKCYMVLAGSLHKIREVHLSSFLRPAAWNAEMMGWRSSCHMDHGQDGKQKDGRSLGPWWLQWPYPPWSACLQTTFTWQRNELLYFYVNGLLWECSIILTESPLLLTCATCTSPPLPAGGADPASMTRSTWEFHPRSATRSSTSSGTCRTLASGQGRQRSCQCSVSLEPAGVSAWGQHWAASMRTGAQFSQDRPREVPLGENGEEKSEEKWGKVGRNFLCATDCWGLGESLFRGPRRERSWCRKCGVLVPVVCSVDCVQCGSLVCGVQLSWCCLLRGLPFPCCMFLVLLS